jgi:hypothetical protein
VRPDFTALPRKSECVNRNKRIRHVDVVLKRYREEIEHHAGLADSLPSVMCAPEAIESSSAGFLVSLTPRNPYMDESESALVLPTRFPEGLRRGRA